MTRVQEVAEALYAGQVAEFTPARTQAEKQAKAEKDKEAAAAIKALRKPSVGAWAVNRLVRRESEQIDQVLTLAESLRAAAQALDGAELRALTKQRRQLIAALTSRARQLALESGTRLTQAVADQVEATLGAAMLDERAAEAVRTGLLVTTFSATGVDDVDFAEALALPDALGSRPPAEAAPERGLSLVPDNLAVRKEAAQDRVREQEKAVEAARRGQRAADKAVAALEADRLRVSSEIDELQRRISGLEDQRDELAEELEVAEQDAEDAAAALGEAEQNRDAAQQELDAL